MDDGNDTRAILLGLLATFAYTSLLYLSFDWRWALSNDTSAVDLVLAWVVAKVEWSLGFMTIWTAVCVAVARDARRMARTRPQRLVPVHGRLR